jgi:Zn-dependent peptidase ImmA (M78 family)
MSIRKRIHNRYSLEIACETSLLVKRTGVYKRVFSPLVCAVLAIVHVMLNDGGICDFAEDRKYKSQSVQTESFCNRVAGAALFPKTEFTATDVVQRHRKHNPVWTDFELQELSRCFGGSREAALVRLLSLNLTTWDYYLAKPDEFYEKHQEAKKKQTGFVAPHTLAVSSAGPTFTRLVIDALNQQRITASDFSDYLQLRFKHLSDVKWDISQLADEK